MSSTPLQIVSPALENYMARLTLGPDVGLDGGTGSQEEYDRAESQPLCKACALRLLDRHSGDA